MQLVRTAGGMHPQDVIAFRKPGGWQSQFPGDELSEDSRLANSRTAMLTVRVRDDRVRELVQTVKNHAVAAGICGSPEEGERAMNAMDAAFERLNPRIGEVLRQLDDAE